MTGGPLTILQLTHQGGPAGSTQSIFNLSQYLNRRGHRVLVGCRDDVLLARLARDAALPVVPLAFLSRGALTRTLAELLARERVDVVNSHATLDRRALTWMRWRGRLPGALVVTRRTMPRTSPLELLPVGLTADRTIAVSEAVARALRRGCTRERGSVSCRTGSRSSASTPPCRPAISRPPGRRSATRTAGRSSRSSRDSRISTSCCKRSPASRAGSSSRASASSPTRGCAPWPRPLPPATASCSSR